MEAIDYDKLAEAVANKIGRQAPAEAIIWSPEECASHLNKSSRSFSEHLSKQAGFPDAVIVPNGQKNGRALLGWRMVDIIKWVDKHGR